MRASHQFTISFLVSLIKRETLSFKMSRINPFVNKMFNLLFCGSVLTNYVSTVYAHPQWGIPAAAEAANSIDSEHFQAISAQAALEAAHQHQPQIIQEQQRILPAAFPASIPSLPTQSRSQELPPSSSPSMNKRRRKPSRKKTMQKRTSRKKSNKGVHGHGHHGPGGMGNMRQQKQFYPPQPFLRPPLQNWGFWKWGQDNVSSFLAAFFN